MFIFFVKRPLNGVIKFIKVTFIKDYIRMIQTKCGDHASVSSVEESVLSFFF
jgi:hypothetical protein